MFFKTKSDAKQNAQYGISKICAIAWVDHRPSVHGSSPIQLLGIFGDAEYPERVLSAVRWRHIAAFFRRAFRHCLAEPDCLFCVEPARAGRVVDIQTEFCKFDSCMMGGDQCFRCNRSVLEVFAADLGLYNPTREDRLGVSFRSEGSAIVLQLGKIGRFGNNTNLTWQP